MSCPYNQAHNRQTWMLADQAGIHCDRLKTMDKTKRDAVLLESAKANLRSMPFVGLTDEQELSAELFQRTFDVEFPKIWVQKKPTIYEKNIKKMSMEQKNQMIHLNKLDIELYQYGKALFYERVKNMRAYDSNRENDYILQ